MSQENYSVLVDAKQEYNHQIINILSSGILKGIKGVYYECENMCQQENTPENVLMVFQDKLSKIPKWTLAKIEHEYQLIKKESKCDWIDDLLKVIYVTHIKILSLVNKVKKKGRLNIKVPTGAQFLHICYVNIAREMWKNPYLCSTHVSRYEQQKNTREMEKIIKDTIMDTLRQQLPVKNIIQDFLDLSEKEDLSLVTTPVEHEDLDNPESKTNLELKNTKYMDKLENIVKDDLSGKNTITHRSKKRERFTNLEPGKVKSILENSKVETSIPLDNLEGDLNEINLEELMVEPNNTKVPEKELDNAETTTENSVANMEKVENVANVVNVENVESSEKKIELEEDALNPELDKVEINGNEIVKETLDNMETEIDISSEIDSSSIKSDNPLPPSYNEIDNALPLEIEKNENMGQQSLDDILTEDDKKELQISSLQGEEENKPIVEEGKVEEGKVEEMKDNKPELMENSSFDKPIRKQPTITKNGLQIDELDSLDLEVEELPSIDLQEVNNKNKETMTTSIRPKKNFTFFTDAPVV